MPFGTLHQVAAKLANPAKHADDLRRGTQLILIAFDVLYVQGKVSHASPFLSLKQSCPLFLLGE